MRIKIRKTWIIAVVLIVGLFLVFGIGQTQYISGQGITNEKFSGTFDGIDFTGQTAYLGSLISEKGSGFCSDNNGKFQLINFFSEGVELRLSSAITPTVARPNGCNGNNYIFSEFEVPAGSMGINYLINSDICPNVPSSSQLIVTIDEKNVFQMKSAINDNIPGDPGQTKEGSEVFVFDKPAKVKIELDTKACSSQADVTVNFSPSISSESIEPIETGGESYVEEDNEVKIKIDPITGEPVPEEEFDYFGFIIVVVIVLFISIISFVLFKKFRK